MGAAKSSSLRVLVLPAGSAGCLMEIILPRTTAGYHRGPPARDHRRPHTLIAMNRLRVLAAMSGGVDSAVAAARAADAGHEVTGVHLALSANPRSYRSGARGCCTLEDARDARRAADVIGIPFYVWDMAERFDRD